ncbi:MAG TPA: BTAD domain-containing putative transcriptional regulator [Streptosporangiaceae bacterium]|nr:BTAD domain-containing putative transcriptional regulator [Streptosporangiaceae bacterium]
MPGLDSSALHVQVLGPVRAWRDGQEVDLGPPQRRAVLAVLAMAAGRIVSRHELIDAVWDAPSDKADSALYAAISRLRGVLEPGRGARDGSKRVLATSGAGYVLGMQPEQVDAGAFTIGVAAARRARTAGDLTRAVHSFEEALGLWQGSALAGVDGMWASAERVRLAEARLVAMEEHAAVRLALGCHAEVAVELAGLVGRHPLREELRRLLMLALYRSGRQADALTVFHDTRRTLDEELGIEPGPALQRMHEQILAADPGLMLPDPPNLAAPAAQTDPAELADTGWEGQRLVPIPRELPADVRAFTGREADLAELDRLLQGSTGDGNDAAGHGSAPSAMMVAAVSGTAGVGKTALVVRWAHRVAPKFPDGQLYVNLRGYDPGTPVSAADALAQFLRALGVTDAEIPLAEDERAARYRSLVAGKQLLVVLDNAATVDQVRPLLPGAATVMVVVTSRDSLAGLVAVDGAHRLVLGRLNNPDTMALLRALIGERVDADPAAAKSLAGKCAKLPLALRVAAELAAARPDTPLAELVAELAGQPGPLGLLDTGDPYGAPATVFSWSYRYLPPHAAAMFRLLGLHPGAAWDRHAAAALAGATLAETSRLLAVLARAHLIAPIGPDRYEMHDLLRAYAASLAASHDSAEDRQAALNRLFDYYLATSAVAVGALEVRYHGPEPPPVHTPVPAFDSAEAALTWLDAEVATLTAVATYAAASGWPSYTTRLAVILRHYLNDRYTYALALYDLALEAARRSGDPGGEAEALIGMGLAHHRQGRTELAAACNQQALDISRETGHRLQLARALCNIGIDHAQQGDFQQAAECNQQALALFHELGSSTGEVSQLVNLGVIYFRQGRDQQAFDCHKKALLLAREIGFRNGEVAALVNLGDACHRMGQDQQASDYLEEALTLSRSIGSAPLEGHALAKLSEARRRRGEFAQAAEYSQLALAICRDAGDREGEIEALSSAAATFLDTGDPAQARACYAAALHAARQSGDRYFQGRVHEGLVNACLAAGEPCLAHEHWQQALVIYTDLGVPDVSRLRTSPARLGLVSAANTRPSTHTGPLTGHSGSAGTGAEPGVPPAPGAYLDGSPVAADAGQPGGDGGPAGRLGPVPRRDAAGGGAA